MSNPTGPDQPDDPTHPQDEPATEVFAPADPGEQPDPAEGERRFTAPSGFDAGSTQIINRPQEPATEIFGTGGTAETEAFTAQNVAPQKIPARDDAPKPPAKKRSWGWVIAIVLVIAALAAVAILGTILLTRGSSPAASQEDKVRATISDFDVAVQNGDLAALRSITCGSTRDSYVAYNDKAWSRPTPVSPQPSNTPSSPASTKSSSTATTPRPT